MITCPLLLMADSPWSNLSGTLTVVAGVDDVDGVGCDCAFRLKPDREMHNNKEKLFSFDIDVIFV